MIPVVGVLVREVVGEVQGLLFESLAHQLCPLALCPMSVCLECQQHALVQRWRFPHENLLLLQRFFQVGIDPLAAERSHVHRDNDGLHRIFPRNIAQDVIIDSRMAGVFR